MCLTLLSSILNLLPAADAKPPMPERAEAMVWEMVSKGMKPTATQSNLVLEAWSKAGNMRRAEMFADRMDPVSRNREEVALATEETYQILKEGWALAGVSNEIQDRRELSGRMQNAGISHQAVLM